MKLRPAHWILIGICVFALLVRLPTIGYGLPFHLYGDEEANIYGALEMLQLHTLLPVLHPQQFNNILYEPPLTAYIYAVVFVPTILIEYVAHGAPPLGAFKDMLLISPSLFWYVARTITVLFSIGSIVLVYYVAKRLLRDEWSALLAAAFLATSFLDTTLAATARHWTFGIFFSLAALAAMLAAYEREEHHLRTLILGGILFGLSFGASYLVYLAPPIFLYILYKNEWRITRASIKDVCAFFILSALVAVLLIAVDPYPLFAQVIHHVTPAGQRSLYTFLSYYGHMIWQYEPLLVGFSIIGGTWLIHKRRTMALLVLGAFFITALLLMYFFFPNLARYLMPLIPMLAIAAGYGLMQCLRVVPYPRLFVPLIAFLLLAYAGAVYGRYEVLMFRNDIRVDAYQWVEQHIPAGSTLLVESDTIHFFATRSSLIVQAQLEPERLHAADRLLLTGAPPPAGVPVYNVYYLSATSSEQRAAVVSYAEATSTSAIYLIADKAAELQAGPFYGASTTLKTFATDASYQNPIPFVGTYQLFIGGNTGLETPAQWNVSLLALLYGTHYFGTDVTIYKL